MQTRPRAISLAILYRSLGRALLIFLFLPAVCAARLTDEEAAAIGTQIDRDQATLRYCDEQLAQVIQFVRDNPELFGERENGLLTFAEKQELRGTWKRFLDLQLSLEKVGQSHRRYYLLRGPLRARSFFTGHGAALIQYRYALEFLDMTARNETLDKIFDEPVGELSEHGGAWSSFRFRFLNAGRAIEFAARNLVYKSYAGRYTPENGERLKEHSECIWRMGRGRGQMLTIGNALKVVREAGFTAWLPVQTGVSEWMGDTKVVRPDTYLITPEQIAGLDVRPGDILLERRDWYLSNLGLPGFWPHAAVYIGTASERRRFFSDPAVQAWVREKGEASGEFERLLESTYPERYERAGRDDGEHPYRVLEAISEGVTFTTLEHSAQADSLAVLRPRLEKRALAAAIFRAFRYAGRPYDFNFDFDTDAALVCTELVCKAYAADEGTDGLSFPVQNLLGRKVTPANEMVRQFDEEFGTVEQQLDLVSFLDAHERSRTARRGTVEEFRESWRRPKWHIFVQGK